MSYTAYPSLNAGASNSGLSNGILGYTVLGTDAISIILPRNTTGIVEIGTGSYVIPAGISIPTGGVYYVKWDRSDTGVVLGAAPTKGALENSTSNVNYKYDANGRMILS